jgi:hypothetical protein
VTLKPAGLALYPILIPLVALPAILLILGVVLPAVWSTRPTRRRAALAVLAVLTLLRHPAPAVPPRSPARVTAWVAR